MKLVSRQPSFLTRQTAKTDRISHNSTSEKTLKRMAKVLRSKRSQVQILPGVVWKPLRIAGLRNGVIVSNAWGFFDDAAIYPEVP